MTGECHHFIYLMNHKQIPKCLFSVFSVEHLTVLCDSPQSLCMAVLGVLKYTKNIKNTKPPLKHTHFQRIRATPIPTDKLFTPGYQMKNS